MKVRTVFAGLVIALLVGSAFLLWRRYSERDLRAAEQSAKAAARTHEELAKFGSVTETQNAAATDPTVVLPDAYMLLREEKHHVRDLVRSVLNAEAPNVSSEQLRRSVVAALNNAGAPVVDPDQQEASTPVQLFGRLTVQVERVLGHRDLVAAKIGTSIPCGTDGALYLFEREGATWLPVLSAEAPAFTSIANAYGALDYVVSPGANGNWYVLIANVTPSCSSSWQGLRYSILRKGSDPEHPTVLLNRETGLYQGWDEFWKLRADADVAQIAWPHHFKLDGAILIRAHVERYRVSGDSATRIPPVAFYPEDFIDEWAQQPWEQAKEWTASEALPQGEQLHTWLRSAEFPTTVEFIQPCPIPEHWQIGFAIDPSATQTPPLPRLYVDVSKDGDVFRLDRIAGDRAPGCPGNDFPPQRPQSLP